MPPPDMPPSIQKPQKSSPNSARALLDQRLGVEVAGPRDDRLDRPVEVALRGTRRCARMSPARSCVEHFVEDARSPPAGPAHSASERSRYFSVTISRIGPTSCAMPPWTSTRLSCSCCARLGGDLVAAEDAVARQQAAAADAELGVALAGRTPWISLMPGQTPPESCQPPPEPPSHSPRIARAATRRRSCFVERAGQRVGSGRWRACRRRSGRPAGWSRPPAASPSGMSLTLLTSSMPWPGRR